MTEDFAEKRRIRARMYKLREKRLKDFYTSDDVMTAGSPSAASLPSQSATSSSSSFNYSTTSAAATTTTTSITSSSAMETDETDGINSQQKRRNDANQEEDAVSEKIRRKSSVRTKRYQMVLAASGDADASSESTTSTKMETSSQQRAMTPDSLSGSQQLIMAADEQIQKSLSIRPEELSISVLSDSSYQELKSSSHRREFQEGDILTIQEVTETWRRIRESGQSNPVTQRVTLTKTIRQRVSDGAVLEENEDEVIDDIDDDTRGSGSGGITAVDAALRRSSIIAITTTNDVAGVEESATVAKKKFETGVIDDNVSEADSLDNNLPEPDNVDTHSLADSLELNQTTSTFTSMTTQQHQSTNRDSFIRMDSDVSNQSVGNLEEQVEELIIPESKPATVTTSSATRTKRTPSESPSRGGATGPAKKRADSAELRRQTTASNTTSRTGLGGINRNASSSSNTSSGANKSKSPSSPSASLIKCSIPRLTSTPISAQKGKKPAVADSPATADDSVTEFLQLEKEIQSEKVEDVSKTTGMKRPVTSSNRPTTPVSSRKAAESVSTRSTSSSRVTSVSSSIPDNKKAMATKTTTSVNRSSTSTTSTGRKELASPSSTKPGSSIGRPTMIRTVETTRTITVRDRDEDKPWRVNSSSASSSNRSKGISGIGRPARKDLHNNVMSVVEKYVDTEGCALHGSHPHIHDDDDDGHHHHHHDGHSPSPPAPEGQKPATEEEEEEPVVAPPAQTNGIAADEPEELSSAAPQEEETPVAEVVAESREENPIQRPKKLSVTTTMHPPMEGAVECATSPLNKSGSRLSIASPVLGSPSVVKKARSLFHSDSFDGSEAPKAPEPVVAAPTATGGTASISKIRSSFESSSTSSSNTSTIKRENTKLWEPANRINKLDRPSLVKDVGGSDSSSTKSVPSPVARPNSSNSGLFSKSRSPSPAKEIATPTASVRQPTQPESTPVPSAVTPADVIPALPSGANQVIEDIEDLTLLENMLNTATNYDDRSRIRAHIRTVKKKLGLAISSPMPQRKAAPAPAAAVTTPKPSEPAVNRNKLPDFKKKEPSPIPVAPVEAKKEPMVAPVEEPVVKTLPELVKVERLLEDVEMSSSVSTLSSSTTTVTEETMTSETSVSRKTSLTQQQQQQTKNVRKISQPYDSRSETKEFVPRVAEEQPTVTVADGDQVNGDVTSPSTAASDQEGSSETSSPKMSRAPWRRQSSEANMMVKTPTHLPEPESNPETLDITSSYGTGPMDENGRPLFGLGALRRRPTKPLNLPGAPEEGDLKNI